MASRLADRGLPVRIGSRSAPVPFDWNDRPTWAGARDGVGAVYLSYQPDLAAPGACDDITAFVDAAAHAGVTRLVLLSGRGEPEALECGGRRAPQRNRLDDRALQLVRAELQRGLPGGPGAVRRSRDSRR